MKISFGICYVVHPQTGSQWELSQNLLRLKIEHYRRQCVVSDLCFLLVKKKDKPRLQNGILEPLKVLSCKHPGHFYGVQGWRSGESARVPPMCPGFDSRTRRHMWVEFVVGPLPCSLLRVLQFFPLLKNQHFQIPIRSWNGRAFQTSSCKLLVLRG